MGTKYCYQFQFSDLKNDTSNFNEPQKTTLYNSMHNKFENNKYIIFQKSLNLQKEILKELEDLNR